MNNDLVLTDVDTPADYGDTVFKILDKSPNGIAADQTSSSLKPVRGRVPVVGRRNLLGHSNIEDAHGWTLRAKDDDGTTWTENYSVTPDGLHGVLRCNPNYVVDPGGAARGIDAYYGLPTENGDEITFSVLVEPVVATSTHTDGTTRDVYVALTTDSASRCYINLNTLTVDVTNDCTASISADPGNPGWYRCSMSYVAGTDVSNNHFVAITNRTGSLSFDPYPDGNEDVRIAGAQVEPGVVLTPIQRVSANGLDVYEEGQQHTEYLRFDHTDDKMVQTFPDGLTGDLVVCGTEGSWVDRNVFVAAGNDLEIGPKNLPNTPNILPALGDIIGWTPVGKTLTEDEWRRIVNYYKTQGAKGQLVPSGVELVANGDFSDGLNGWSSTDESAVSVTLNNNDVILEVVGDINGSAVGVGRTVSGLTVGKSYVAKMEIVAFNGTNEGGQIYVFGSNVAGAPVPAVGEAFAYFTAVNANQTVRFGIRMFGESIGDTMTIDSCSVQELIPEEDLA